MGESLLHRAFGKWLTRGQSPADLQTLRPSPRDYAWIAIASLAEAAGWPIDTTALDDGIDWLSDVALDRVGVPAPLTRDSIAQIAIALAVRHRPRLQSWLSRVVRHAKRLHEPAWASSAALLIIGDFSDELIDPALIIALESCGFAIDERYMPTSRLRAINWTPKDPLHAVVMMQALVWIEQVEMPQSYANMTGAKALSDSTDRIEQHGDAAAISTPAAAPVWIELIIDRIDNEVRVGARGSRDEQIPAQPIAVTRDALVRFASSIQRAAQYGVSLTPELVADAHAIERAVLGREINALFHRLRETTPGELLVRLLIHGAELQAVPWEALCAPGEALGFWGTSPKVLPVRKVLSSEPWQPRKITGAIRVLAIAPTSGAGLANLKMALEPRINTGAVEWLRPITNEMAKLRHLPKQLAAQPNPHVVHFLGHGRIDGDGRPALRMADDDDGEENWLSVDVFAQHLQANLQETLRLVVLEACEGAAPTAFASAAEILARAGVDAVVAHLWAVRADVARTCSTELYRALTQSNRSGDIAAAINEARRCILTSYETSAEAHSPVLFLRGPQSRIFDFTNRDAAARAQ